jgi:hypothetical protein
MKKGTFGNFTGFGHQQTSETSGRNMAVELHSRHPLVFFSFTNLALKALLSAKLSIFSLRIRVKSPFSHPVFGRSGCRLSNSTAIFPLIAMYAQFIPISAVESFVVFPFTEDYLNLEMIKIIYLLGVS